MSKPQTYLLREDRDRHFALRAVQLAPFGMAVVIDKPKRSTEANKRLWSMIHAIVKAETKWAGHTWEPADWYDLLWSAFLREKQMETGQTMSGIAGEIVTIGQYRPSQANSALFSEFSTSVLAFIDQHGIHWAERGPAEPPPEAYDGDRR